MKKLMAIAFALFVCQTGANAQNTENNNQSKFKITSMSASAGNLKIYHQNSTLNELKQITTNSKEFYSDDIANYNLSTFNNYSVGAYNVNIGLTPFSKKFDEYRQSREIQIGFSISSGYRRGFYYLDMDVKSTDSINFHGNIITSDSVSRSSIDYDEYMNDVSLSIAYLFKTKNKTKFGAFAGLAVDIGFTFLSEVEKYKDLSSYIDIKVNGYQTNQTNYTDSDYFENQTAKTDNSMFVRTSIPIGISYRLSKKDNFLGLIHLFSQGKFGVEYQRYGSKYSYLNTLLGIDGGLKFNI